MEFSGRRLTIRATETEANEGLVRFNFFFLKKRLWLSIKNKLYLIEIVIHNLGV